MSYAPHSNTDVHQQLQMGWSPTPLPLLFGYFLNENGIRFEYAERRWPSDDFAPEMPHVIYLDRGETRLAKVLKTVAYVVVDEDDNGPVIQKWQIHSHAEYDTSWVRP